MKRNVICIVQMRNLRLQSSMCCPKFSVNEVVELKWKSAQARLTLSCRSFTALPWLCDVEAWARGLPPLVGKGHRRHGWWGLESEKKQDLNAKDKSSSFTVCSLPAGRVLEEEVPKPALCWGLPDAFTPGQGPPPDQQLPPGPKGSPEPGLLPPHELRQHLTNHEGPGRGTNIS